MDNTDQMCVGGASVVAGVVVKLGVSCEEPEDLGVSRLGCEVGRCASLVVHCVGTDEGQQQEYHVHL